jgi:hypothetical protein
VIDLRQKAQSRAMGASAITEKAPHWRVNYSQQNVRED